MSLKHKYIRLAESEESYNLMLTNRELEEAAVVAIIDDREETPDTYQYSIRTTNKDNEVIGHYNAIDPIKTFGGLELIWGYFGWTWEDIEYEELPLRGGHFIIIKDTSEYPRIYDGYRLQHINNLCSELRKDTKIGYFDNSEVVSAENAFTTIVENSYNTYYYGYGKLDEQDNVWSKLVNCTNMFHSKNNFTNWNLPTTELYLPEVVNCNNLFREYTLDSCPIVNFDKLETIITFTSNIYKQNYTKTLYFGDYEDSIAKGLSKCYDYGLWNINTQGDYKFKAAYVGNKTFILPRITVVNNNAINLTVECNIPWTITGVIKNNGSNYSNIKVNLDNLDFSKVVVPENRNLTLLNNVWVSQDSSNNNYTPGLPNKVQPIWLMENCTIKGNFVFDAQNDNVDYGYFREFNNCIISTENDSLTINNLHLWNQINFNVTGIYRIDVENQTSTSYRPYNINIQLCPKQNGNIQKVQFSYLNLPYMIHKDEDIELTSYETIGYQDEEDKVLTNDVYFKGKYENCTYHINIDVPVDFTFQLVDGVTPKIVSDIPICFKQNAFLLSRWGLNTAATRKIYLSGLQLKDPSTIMEGMDVNGHKDYWYWYLPDAENLEYIDLPIIDNMSYRFDKASKLDHNCIINHFSQLSGKARTITLNRLVWNKLTNEQQEMVRSKVLTLDIHENES